MAFVKEILTKTGKKMYLTEVNGKTYASFDLKAVDAFLAGREVNTKPGNGNWVFITLPKQYGETRISETPYGPVPHLGAPLTSTPGPGISLSPQVVTNGSTAILKTKLQQVISELNELVTSLD